MKVPVHDKLIPFSEPARVNAHLMTEIKGITWNGKKPHGGKACPKIRGKTVAKYVIEDRR